MTVKVAAEAPEGTHPEALAIEAMRQCVLEALDYLGRLVQGEFAS
jgi:transcriptional regulator, tetR family